MPQLSIDPGAFGFMLTIVARSLMLPLWMI
jgi:hypothetical protein